MGWVTDKSIHETMHRYIKKPGLVSSYVTLSSDLCIAVDFVLLLNTITPRSKSSMQLLPDLLNIIPTSPPYRDIYTIDHATKRQYMQ